MMRTTHPLLHHQLHKVRMQDGKQTWRFHQFNNCGMNFLYLYTTLEIPPGHPEHLELEEFTETAKQWTAAFCVHTLTNGYTCIAHTKRTWKVKSGFTAVNSDFSFVWPGLAGCRELLTQPVSSTLVQDRGFSSRPNGIPGDAGSHLSFHPPASDWLCEPWVWRETRCKCGFN